MKIKFTLIDYIIIILVICAVAFAFIHIASDDSSNIQKTSFDSSTINKLPETYLNYYKNGYIVKATVKGTNASTGEEVTINGIVKWVEEGTNVKVLIETDNGTFLAGLYKNVPNADIYIDTISIETDGSVYNNLVEFKIKPQEINSLSDLSKNLTNGSYEISTTIAVDDVSPIKIQELENLINTHNKRTSVKLSNEEQPYQIIITKADGENIQDGASVLGPINGLTSEITIRVYNCSDSEIEFIKNNFEVTNIRKF